MPLKDQATFDRLLKRVRNQPPDKVFSILSQEFKIRSHCNKETYKQLCGEIHPDKCRFQGATELTAILTASYSQLTEENSKHLSPVISETVAALHILILDESPELWNFNTTGKEKKENILLGVLEALLLPITLPASTYFKNGIVMIPEETWEKAKKNLAELLETIQQKEQEGDLTGTTSSLGGNGAELIIFQNKDKLTCLFRDIYSFWLRVKKESEKRTEEEFLNEGVLRSIQALRWNREEFNMRTVDKELHQLFGLGHFKNNFPNNSTDLFIINKSLEERQTCYLTIRKRLESPIKIMTYLNNYELALGGTINAYEARFSGFLGTIRAFFKKHLAPKIWEKEQKAIANLREVLKDLRNHWGSIPRFEALKDYPFSSNALPLVEQNESPYLFALIERLRQLRNTLSASSAQESYQHVLKREASHEWIAKEMGVWGLLGPFGHTTTYQRCLHQLKQMMLDDLINEANNDSQHTVRVPNETLKMLSQNNSRLWHVGETSSLKILRKQFKHLAEEEYQLR